MAVLDSTSLYFTIPWLHLALLYSATLYHGFTWVYYTLSWLNSILPSLHLTLYVTLLVSTISLFHSAMTLRDSSTFCHVSTWLYFTLLHSTMVPPSFTLLYYTLPSLLLALRHSTTLYHVCLPFYHGST